MQRIDVDAVKDSILNKVTRTIQDETSDKVDDIMDEFSGKIILMK
jgi:hypothetical protein